MSYKKTDLKEFIRIKDTSVRIGTYVAVGKDGDYYVMVSPSVLVSGYGKTEKEAEDSFKENINLFCQDLLNTSKDKREDYLLTLGFIKERYKTKNFSKLYVDSNGALQGLEEGTIKRSFIEAVA